MVIFPAIDIRNRKCVRLFKGDFQQETVFSEAPEEIAETYARQGAEFLHIVDLDGARAGQPQNLEVVKNILFRSRIPVQLGGGIRNMESIAAALDMGVSRVILGSIAVRDPRFVQEACQKYGGRRIVVGIDAREGIVAVDGWGVSGQITSLDLARKMADIGVETLIYTDISRDGTLSGLNLPETVHLAKQSGLKVIASGGVASLEDLRKIKAYSSLGIEGVIVGKALYTGAFTLSDALKIS